MAVGNKIEINSGITLPLLIDRDKDLATELTRYFCLCHKYLEDITAIRNLIAHASSECSVNDDIFVQFWDTTADNIIGIAKALDLHNDYDAKLKELQNECSNSYCQTCLVDLIKKTDHVTPEILQKIDDSKEEKETQFEVIMACMNDFHIDTCTENESSSFVASFADDLKQFAIALRKKTAPENSSENPVEMELKFSLDIRDTSTQKHRKRSQDSEDDLSNKDERPDRLICGKCNVTFTHLDEFCVHKENCCKREKKKTEQDPSKKITFLMKMIGADNKWTIDVMKMCLGEPDCFNTDKIDVRLLESSCLIVWAESSQSDIECAKQLKDNCIKFTQNMFHKCSLESNEAVKINVTVKCSELFEESTNDDADHLECGKCGQVCRTINSFITHKKECVRNRKRRRENKQDESKGDIRSAPNSKQSRTGRISKEEENFLRIAVLIIRVASAAVRFTFIKEFHGNALQKTLFEDPAVLVSTEQEKIMSQYDLQQIILHGRSETITYTALYDTGKEQANEEKCLASLYSFSLKLMIWLIRYRTPSDEYRGLLDDPKHISVHAGLSRILIYKNKLARMKYPKLQEEKLEEYWTDISQAIVRLGGEGFQQKCNDLKVSILNENYNEMLTEIIEIVKSNDSNTQGFQRLLDNLFYVKSKTVSPRTTTESNYKRIADLLLRVGPLAVRIIFDREFHPKLLQRELRKKTARLAHLKGKGLINAAQWDKLFKSKDENKSKTFDLSLMICLIRYLTTIEVTDQLPRPDDESEGAALSRLEYYRKQIAYSQECDLSVTVFEKYWADITNAIVKIGGNIFLQRCNDLKIGKLDQKDKAILPEPTSSNIPN